MPRKNKEVNHEKRGSVFFDVIQKVHVLFSARQGKESLWPFCSHGYRERYLKKDTCSLTFVALHEQKTRNGYCGHHVQNRQ